MKFCSEVRKAENEDGKSTEVLVYQILPEFCRIFPIRPRRNVRGPHRVPTVTPQGPRSLHFRGKRPILRFQKLASSCARPAAALRDHPVCPRQCGIPELTDLLDPSTLTSDEESDCRLGHLRNKTASTFFSQKAYDFQGNWRTNISPMFISLFKYSAFSTRTWSRKRTLQSCSVTIEEDQFKILEPTSTFNEGTRSRPSKNDFEKINKSNYKTM